MAPETHVKEESLVIRKEYYRLARQILPVSDIKKRALNRTVLANLNQLRETPGANALGTMDSIFPILEDNDNMYPTLSKVYALDAITEIATKNSLWTDRSISDRLSQFLGHVTDTNLLIIYQAAIQARYMYFEMSAGDQDKAESFYNQLIAQAKARNNSRHAYAVAGATRALYELLKDDKLHMTLKVSILTEDGEGTEYFSVPRERSGEPGSVVHLGINGHLVSWEKLQEAAEKGMPNGILALEKRLPHLLFGIQVDDGFNTHTENTPGAGSRLFQRRKLYHVSLPSFDIDESKYDSLSGIVAIRAIRTTGENPDKDVLIQTIESIVDGKILQGASSIATVAWHESYSTSFDPSKFRQTLINKAFAICKNDQFGGFRDQNQIRRVLKEHVLGQISLEDKIELALIEMRNLESSVRRHLQDSPHLEEINSYISKGGKLSTEALNTLVDLVDRANILNDLLTLRCETIRDKDMVSADVLQQ